MPAKYFPNGDYYIFSSLAPKDVDNNPPFGAALFAADFEGRSLVAGKPTMSYFDKTIELFGFYSCLPFEQGISTNLPNVNISTSSNVINGVSKSTMSSWQAGFNASTSFGPKWMSVSAHFGKSYGGSTMHMGDTQKNVSIHLTSGASDSDLIHGYAANFYVWDYPVYQKSAQQEHFATVTVVVPEGFSDTVLDTTEPSFLYDQDYEIGKILTYINRTIPGYVVAQLLFKTEVFSSTADTQGGGTTLMYSKTNSTTTSDQTTYDNSMNAGASISLHAGGLGASISGYYSKHNMTNNDSSTTVSKDLSISFHSGVVKDEAYEYRIKPLVYHHIDNNMLMIFSEIKLTGPAWKQYFNSPDVMLMKVYPFTKIENLKHFTRSIRYVENKDGSVDIQLHIFNNSYNNADSVVGKIYLGQAIYVAGKEPDVSHCKLLGQVTSKTIAGTDRQVLVLKKSENS